MESGSVPVETRINAILDYEVKKQSKKAIARKYGVSESTVRGWMHTRDYFVNKCLEIAKINEEGKLNYFLGEVTMEKAEENPQTHEGKRTVFNSPKKTFYTGRIQQNEEK